MSVVLNTAVKQFFTMIFEMSITLKHVNFRPFRCQKYFLHKNKWIKNCIIKKYTDKNTNKNIEKKDFSKTKSLLRVLIIFFLSNFFSVFWPPISVF